MKYPAGSKTVFTKKEIDYSNRGMNLEEDINLSNEYYRSIDKAYIYKKPTPIQITKVDYPSRNKAVIKEAYFLEPSTTDYNGIYKGKYIDFEAKQTSNNTSFPLSNIHKHQIKHIENVIRHKGVAFLIIRFTRLNETYLLEGEKLIDYINNNTKKSIPHSYFLKNAKLIKDEYRPRIDYLKIVDEILEVDKK